MGREANGSGTFALPCTLRASCLHRGGPGPPAASCPQPGASVLARTLLSDMVAPDRCERQLTWSARRHARVSAGSKHPSSARAPRSASSSRSSAPWSHPSSRRVPMSRHRAGHSSRRRREEEDAGREGDQEADDRAGTPRARGGANAWSGVHHGDTSWFGRCGGAPADSIRACAGDEPRGPPRALRLATASRVRLRGLPCELPARR
jgi:hypothetical protein